MAVWQGTKAQYVSTAKRNNIPVWAAGHAYNVGDIIRPTDQFIVTITIANPAVLTYLNFDGTTARNHHFTAGEFVVFLNNSDTLPSSFVFGTTYFDTSPATNTSDLAATPGGANISTLTQSQSGTHKVQAVKATNTFNYMCVAAGTSAATNEPDWGATVTRGAKFTDNTVTWVEVTGNPGLNGDFTNTPNWTTGAKSTTPGAGHVITDVAGTHVFVCSTSGAAGTGAEPSWNTAAVGNTTVDASATWTYIGTVATWSASGKQWGCTHGSIQAATQSTWGDQANTSVTTIYVDKNHNANIGGNGGIGPGTIGLAATPVSIICVNPANNNTPPLSTDVTTGATELYGSSSIGGTATGSNGTYQYGITWGYSATCVNSSFTVGGATVNTENSYDHCTFQFSTNASNTNTQTQGALELRNCTWKIVAVGQTIQFNNSTVKAWSNGGSILAPGSVQPTNLFECSVSSVIARFCGFDFSTITGNLFNPNSQIQNPDFTFETCRLPTSVPCPQANFAARAPYRVRFVNCDNGAFFNDYQVYDWLGTIATDRVVWVSTGAIIDGSNFSLKATASAGAGPQANAMKFPPICPYNILVSPTACIITIKGMLDGTALPNNSQLWLDVEYPATTWAPITSFASTKVAPLATPASSPSIVADTSNWTGNVTARQNSTTYSAGAQITVASNPTRVFICTVGGATAGSPPGGYASAVDGGSVVDGAATFRAAVRFTLSITLQSPLEEPAWNGLLGCLVRYGVNSGGTLWIDPTAALT